jgi:hypothetical protein
LINITYGSASNGLFNLLIFVVARFVARNGVNETASVEHGDAGDLHGWTR